MLFHRAALHFAPGGAKYMKYPAQGSHFGAGVALDNCQTLRVQVPNN